ncbi:MAG: hypothetical protein II399_06530 [Lachnospiraceae bacterium]|nr:hypothetical protein [Lachnospiraceae bacterium]
MNIELKYPVLLVHGIFCRDVKKQEKLKTWGYIPAYLKQKGVKLYYGHTDACGTVKRNAAILKKQIEKIIHNTGCEKVNIIAHSKGGLESRYMISKLGMEHKVASLTTLDTPHRGSPIADTLFKVLPDKIFKFIAGIIDRYEKKQGDIVPDIYTSTREATTSYCEEFNQNIEDKQGVLYQSVALTCVRFSPKYWLSKIIMNASTKEKNDGIVTESSSKWGVVLSNIPLKYCNHSQITDARASRTRKKLIFATYDFILNKLAEAGV